MFGNLRVSDGKQLDMVSKNDINFIKNARNMSEAILFSVWVQVESRTTYMHVTDLIITRITRSTGKLLARKEIWAVEMAMIIQEGNSYTV